MEIRDKKGETYFIGEVAGGAIQGKSYGCTAHEIKKR